MEAAKTGKLTPALLQEGQTIDILENVADLSLIGGGSIRIHNRDLQNQILNTYLYCFPFNSFLLL